MSTVSSGQRSQHIEADTLLSAAATALDFLQDATPASVHNSVAAVPRVRHAQRTLKAIDWILRRGAVESAKVRSLRLAREQLRSRLSDLLD